MDGFDKREEGFERAFSREEELRFRARARRNRKLAVWAGEKLGLAGADLERYVAEFAAREAVTRDDEGLVADLKQALAPFDVSEHRIRRRLETFGAEALQELHAGR